MKWIAIGVFCFLSAGSALADTMKSSFTGDIGYAPEEGATVTATASNIATLGLEHFAEAKKAEQADRGAPNLASPRLLANMGILAGFLLVTAFLVGRAETRCNSGFN